VRQRSGWQTRAAAANCCRNPESMGIESHGSGTPETLTPWA
jgi:hypothetical protein